MFKALFKKQMMEVNTWLIYNKKNGKIRSKAGMTGLILLYIFLFVFVGNVFFMASKALCPTLVSLGLSWMYFSLMSLMAVIMGVFGSVFNTFSTLYNAKDNELLLSMPIKPSYILIVRLLGVYLWSFIYTAIVFIPAIIVFFLNVKFSFPALIGSIIMLIVLSVFVLMLSCILGYVIAKISVKLKRKSFITVLISLVFIALYYFVYFKAMDLMKDLLANAITIGAEIKGKALPVYWLGKASTGDFLSLLIIALTVALLMILTLYIMSRSFIKISTSNKGEKKKVYKSRKTSLKSADSALLSKEFRRYASSANYILNCSLGTLFLPILGISALIKMNWLRKTIAAIEMPHSIILLIVCLMLCFLSSLNDVSAPSISLEGKNLWLVQSLPIKPWQVLKAKLKLHLLLTEIPVVFCAVCVCISIGLDPLHILLCLIAPVLFVLFVAQAGLALNLLLPNLNWTNEIVPIKQSAPVIITLFGGWLLVGIFTVLYFWFGIYLTIETFITVCIVILLAMCIATNIWLKFKGTKIFKAL